MINAPLDNHNGICIIKHTEYVVINDLIVCFNPDLDAESFGRAVNPAEHETIIALTVKRT